MLKAASAFRGSQHAPESWQAGSIFDTGWKLEFLLLVCKASIAIGGRRN